MSVATLVDLRTSLPHSAPLGLVADYVGAVVEVANLSRARSFYAGLLGFEVVEERPDTLRLRIGAEHDLVLVRRDRPQVLPMSGTHVAYRFPATGIARVCERLAGAGVAVERYHEDRALERAENRYCADPDGNRVQLVAADRGGIDHAAIEAHDLEWAELFYTHVLGGVVETRVGWRMEDYVRAWSWGEGRDECAPGTRRWDKRYRAIEGDERLPRPNAHIFVALAPGVVLGVYLATEHRQDPPLDVFVGTPRLVFRTGASAAELERRLVELRLRCMRASERTGAPFERADGSLFVRDPGGNFLELRR